MDTNIILPATFKHPRYMGGLWLDTRLHWSDEDLDLLAAAADLKISYDAAANTLGRNPTALVAKALQERILIPREWRSLVYNYKKREPKLKLQYPYIVQPDERHADLIAVNRMVSRALPGREDVCQDVMLALWESRTSLSELRTDPKALKAFIRSFRKASFERSGYNVESMDVTIHSNDGDGKSKYEDAKYQRTLVDNDDQYIEDAIFKHGRVTNDFAARTINELTDEEESLGIPAAFWARAEA